MIGFKQLTYNPIIGCSKVSAGCLNCYAELIALRLRKLGNKTYKDGFKFKTLPERLNEPLKNKKPTLYFIGSMSDIFHEQMSFDFLDKILLVISKSPYHQYQMLTKRPHRMREYFKARKIPQNLWLGTTVENADMKYRIELIRDLDASVKWLCCEPLIGDLGEVKLNGIDWVCVGGESGIKAREMKKEWVLSVMKQCLDSKVAFYFRGWSEFGGVRELFGDKIDGKEYKQYPIINLKGVEKSLFDV